MRARNENHLPVARDQKVSENETVAPTRRRHTGGRARDEKVIGREDGYTYIAVLRSPDLRHTTKREGDTSVTVVTSNVSVSQGIIEIPYTG